MRTPLQKGETILLTTYSSWVSLSGPLLLALTGCVVSYFMGFIRHYGWIVASAGLLYLLVRYFSWKAYIWVVTNYRVIDEAGLFRHYAKESPLDKINNVSYDQNLWGRIFNYGHVEIQTAAQIGATDYFNVHDPKKLKDTITQAQADYTHIKTTQQATQLAAALVNPSRVPVMNLSAELEKLYELKERGILTSAEYEQAKSKLLGN